MKQIVFPIIVIMTMVAYCLACERQCPDICSGDMLSVGAIGYFMPENDIIIPVKFDPRSFRIERKNNYAAYRSADSYDIHQAFNGPETTVVKVCLYFESTDAAEDIRFRTKQISDLMTIGESLNVPPLLVFTWGRISYHVVIESISEHYRDIHANGLPSKATLKIEFREYRPFSSDME
ncbi:MAG: hypothetical protein JW881_15405 [Spirochaetales bacterium]|nr:hypothetical protein [Spirochaetales bacterium]